MSRGNSSPFQVTFHVPSSTFVKAQKLSIEEEKKYEDGGSECYSRLSFVLALVLELILVLEQRMWPGQTRRWKWM